MCTESHGNLLPVGIAAPSLGYVVCFVLEDSLCVLTTAAINIAH